MFYDCNQKKNVKEIKELNFYELTTKLSKTGVRTNNLKLFKYTINEKNCNS